MHSNCKLKTTESLCTHAMPKPTQRNAIIATLARQGVLDIRACPLWLAGWFGLPAGSPGLGVAVPALGICLFMLCYVMLQPVGGILASANPLTSRHSIVFTVHMSPFKLAPLITCCLEQSNLVAAKVGAMPEMGIEPPTLRC